jgi:heme o synthase
MTVPCPGPSVAARPPPPLRLRAVLRNYSELTKPKVVAAVVFTAIVGMLLATDGPAPVGLMLIATAGIWLAAASAAALNHLIDRRLDAAMMRTRRRPLPLGELTEREVLIFALALAALSMLILALGVNLLTAYLTLGALIGYSLIYTAWLKPLTPQNVVIGGAAGAVPPILGWAAIRNAVDANSLALFLVIFIWTPAHFWALAIARRREYAKAGVPMLPVTHGVPFTCDHILMYTILLALATVLPFLLGMCSVIYLAAAVLLDALFVLRALELRAHPSAEAAMRTFHYSIRYLLLLFTALLVDHYWHLR